MTGENKNGCSIKKPKQLGWRRQWFPKAKDGPAVGHNSNNWLNNVKPHWKGAALCAQNSTVFQMNALEINRAGGVKDAPYASASQISIPRIQKTTVNFYIQNICFVLQVIPKNARFWCAADKWPGNCTRTVERICCWPDSDVPKEGSLMES